MMTKYAQVYYDLIKDGMHPYSAAKKAYLYYCDDGKVTNITTKRFAGVNPGESTEDCAQQMHYHNLVWLSGWNSSITFGDWGVNESEPESNCKHEWAETMGLTKVYRDCKLCGAKDD